MNFTSFFSKSLPVLLALSALVSACKPKAEDETPYALENGVPTPEGKTWQPVPEFSDEFNGDEIDETKWNIEPQGHTELNWIGREPALFQKESFGIGNGNLTIEVGKLPAPITVQAYGREIAYSFYGGIMRSYTTTSIGRYYECRMKMNKTEMGGGFWLCHAGTCENKHEIDITESVGRLTEHTHAWAKDWDRIMHSNAILRKTECHEKETRDQRGHALEHKNHEKYHVYGFWWKSATELLFYVDGEYVYTLTPPVPFDQNLFMQFSIEAYHWNPFPENGSKVETGTLEERTTYVDYIRTFELVDNEN